MLQNNEKKRCLTPNPWIVSLRTHKDQFHAIEEASKYYIAIFKTILLERSIRIAGKNVTVQRTKQVYMQAICSHLYKYEVHGYNGNKRKVKGGVTKNLQNNTILKTLALLGAKKKKP